MVITIMAYLMVAIFMVLIMKKWMSPLSALVIVPVVFAIIAMILGVADKGDLGTWVLKGIETTSETGIMLLFAILYFSIMLDTGLFDPITRRMIHIAKGDPMKILMATAIVSAAVSMNGDGTTTTLIVVSAFMPIYLKLDMKMMNLAVLLILQNTIMNLLPWGGPTARAMAVFHVGANILTYLLPGMIISILYVIFIVARGMGKRERKRLGVTTMSDEEIDAMIGQPTEEELKYRRPKLFAFNGIMTILLIVLLVVDSFLDLGLPPLLLFLLGTVIALVVNYPVLKDQSTLIGKNGGDAVQVVILVFAAGVFMGLFQGTGMATGLAHSLTSIIPHSLSGYWGIIITLISAPGTFFLSNDGFYFGVVPVLREAGLAYGFTDMQMALASLMGQAFHLLSPLVAFIYLLLRLTKLDMGEWQRATAKYAIVVFAIFVVTVLALGAVPIHVG